MNIVIVSDGGNIAGGAEKVALSTAVALAEQGHNVGVFAGIGPLDPIFEKAPPMHLECLGHEDFYRTKAKGAALRRLLWNEEAKERFEKFLDRYSPQDTIVHFHSFRRILSTSVVSVAAKRGFPRVMTLHDYGIMCPNTAYYHYPDQKPCTFKPLGTRCLAKQCTREGWAMKGAMVARQLMISKVTNVPRLIRDYICVSRFSRELMLPYLPKDVNTDPVLFPIDVEKRPPVDVARNRDFTFIGRMESEKDPVLLAKAGRRLGAPVTFVGDGPQKDAIAEANPDANLLGWQRPEGVRQAMENARCLVLTSRWYETAGLVVIDALASGVPVLVPHTCAATEFVKEGETGLIFESGNDADLARKMAILQDDEVAARMGRQAYEEFWRDPETMEKYIQGILPVYERVIRSYNAA